MRRVREAEVRLRRSEAKDGVSVKCGVRVPDLDSYWILLFL